MKKIFLIFLLFFIQLPLFAEEIEVFNLSALFENMMNYQEKDDSNLQDTKNAGDIFLYATKNFSNGNVVVAYSEFLKTIDNLNGNISLLMLSHRLYQLGFFTLGDYAISKISKKQEWQKQIDELTRAYKPSFNLKKDEEIYLGKIYTSIYYNSSPEEAAFNLVKKNILLENSDYANFLMAQAMFECHQYNQALIYVERAIEKNDKNSNYKVFKAKTLLAMKKYKDALKYVEQNENSISLFFNLDLKCTKQQILANLNSNDADTKFYQLYPVYLNGNYYKTIKETQNILNFTKRNYKILTLQAMAHIALKDYNSAKSELKESYSLNKSFPQTIMALADLDFINGNYKEAYQKYKKLFGSDLKKEAVLKASFALSNMQNAEKKLAKVNKIKNEIESKSYYEYYLISNNLYTDTLNKRKYAAKSLSLNVINPNTWNILLETEYADKNFNNIDKITFLLLFSDDFSAEYYYYSALSLNNKNQKKQAFYELKKALNLNPDYKPAQNLMNELQNELI